MFQQISADKLVGQNIRMLRHKEDYHYGGLLRATPYFAPGTSSALKRHQTQISKACCSELAFQLYGSYFYSVCKIFQDIP